MDFIKKNIANIFTLANLTAGFIGIIAVMYSDVFIQAGMLTQKSFIVRHGSIIIGSYLVFVSAFFDFFDGFIAKLLKTTSEFGKQLDSLADIVSFGVLPAMILHNLILRSNQEWSLFIFKIPALSLLPVIIVLGSAIRLAKFNIQSSKSYFNGLPTPANAIFWASIPLVLNNDLYVFGYKTLYLDNFISNPFLLSLVAIVLVALMLVNIPMLSFKFNGFAFKDNFYKYLLIISFLILFAIFYFLAIPLTIILYIFISIIFKEKIKN